MMRVIVIVVFALQLFSCANISEKKELSFDLEGREYLYEKEKWSFLGKIALSNEKDAVSASIAWDHLNKKETIELVGLFGMGRTRISLRDEQININVGEENKTYYGDVNDIISSRLGVEVPLSALRYWVLGLVDPRAGFRPLEKGFEQYGWQVTFSQMQKQGGNKLPRKVKVERDMARVKLFIKRWDI